MKIACKNNKEVQVVLRQLEKQGCRWRGGDLPTKLNTDLRKATIFVDNKVIMWSSSIYPDAVDASKLYSNLLR